MDILTSSAMSALAQKHLHITVYTHHFSIDRPSSIAKSHTLEYLKRNIKWKFESDRFGNTFRVMDCVFAAATAARDEFRIHINQLADYIEYINARQLPPSTYTISYAPSYEPAIANFNLRPQWSDRDYQLGAIEYLLKEKPVSKLLSVQTGKGKTYMAMRAAAARKKRLLILVRPMYMEKWLIDVQKYLNVTVKDVLFVKGSKSLKALMEMAHRGILSEKIIILSNKTFQAYLSEYERFPRDMQVLGYRYCPHEFHSALGIGVRLIDEVHQDFHLQFKVDCYTHCPQSISLSATLSSYDPHMSRMYEIAYPKKHRFAGIPIDKYINSYAVHYDFKEPNKVKYRVRGRKDYNHGELEKYILANPTILKNYLDLIATVVDARYMTLTRAVKKCAIFASSVAMCTVITEFLQERYPHLSVKRYVADDPYENLIEPDIRVTTILSGGTAHDISDLTTVILTIAVHSKQSNEQTLGRLRKLDDGHPVGFFYFVCTSIPTHGRYHEKKKELLADLALTRDELITGRLV